MYRFHLLLDRSHTFENVHTPISSHLMRVKNSTVVNSLSFYALFVQINLCLNMTFKRLYMGMSTMALRSGSVIVSTVFRLQSHVNTSSYTNSLVSNVFSVFHDAGFDVDNSSFSMNSTVNFYFNKRLLQPPQYIQLRTILINVRAT